MSKADLAHAVGGEDWRRRAAEADKSGQMMKKLLAEAQQQQALFEVANASKRLKNLKPGECTAPLGASPSPALTPVAGWRLQERDRKNLLVAVQQSRDAGHVDTFKIVSPESCERMLYCVQQEGWLNAHDAYGWTCLMHATEACVCTPFLLHRFQLHRRKRGIDANAHCGAGARTSTWRRCCAPARTSR